MRGLSEVRMHGKLKNQNVALNGGAKGYIAVPSMTVGEPSVSAWSGVSE